MVGRARVVHAQRRVGSCSHAMGEGRSLRCPPLCVSPSGWALGRRKGGGHSRGCLRGRGTCDAALIFAAAPIFPRSRASFVCYARVRERDARGGGRRVLSRLSGGEGRKGGVGGGAYLWASPYIPPLHRGRRVRSPLFREASHWRGGCAQRRGPISVGPLLCAHPVRMRKWGEGRGGNGGRAPPIVLCNGGGGQRGGAGFRAPCLVRVIGGAKGRGGAYLSCVALLPCLRAEAGWRQPHAQREGEAATCRAGRHQGGARTAGGGACGMRGRVCIYSPTLPLCTLQFVCAGVGRRERVEERVGGGGGYPPFFPRTPPNEGGVCSHVIFLYLYLFSLPNTINIIN